MVMRCISLSAGAILLWSCAGPECDATGLTSALAGASGGDLVRVGACRIEGDFAIPEDVTLRGEPGSVIAGRIDLVGSGALERIAVESESAGVVARSGSNVLVHDVEITAARGIGLAANGVTMLVVDGVTVRGPIDASNVSAIEGAIPDPMTTATHGIIVENVPNAALTDVSVRGFARFGALLKDSAVTWTGGGANGNAWVGIMVAGGTASLADVSVHDTFDLRIDHTSTFGVVTGTAAIDTARLSVERSGGFGLFHLRGSAVHRSLNARENAYGGVRLELTTAAEIGGELGDNDFGAIVAYAADNLVIADATITNSAMAMRPESERTIEAGDGIQLVDSTQGGRIENTVVRGNDRAGIVIDLFGRDLTAGFFDDVTVERDDPAANGVLVQGGSRASGWDGGLIRDAATITADEAFTGTIDTVGAVGPCFFPAPST